MKFRIRLFIFIAFLSSCTFANDLLRDKVESLNSQSVELLGLSLLELSKLHSLPPGGLFMPLDILEGNGDLEILERLEEKGYLTVEELSDNLRKINSDIPFSKTDRHILLSSKGRELLEILQQTSI